MLNSFARWFSRTAFWIWFVKNVMAKFTFRMSEYPMFPVEELWSIIAAISASEVQGGGKWRSLYAFTSTDYESFGSKLIRGMLRGKASHGGIIIPGATAAQFKIFHLTSKGAQYENLANILKEVDMFNVSRFNIPEDKAQLLERRINFLIANKDMLTYDFQGELETAIDWNKIDARLNLGEIPRLKEKVPLYCSETVRSVLTGIVNLPFHIEKGRPSFEPDDIRIYSDAEIFTFEPEVKKHGVMRWILVLTVLPILILASLLP